ncbi:hypothetical protein P9112_006171 [Eukaryota sp. TZLM1-RC]
MFEKGLEFYNDERYQEAVFWWRRGADAGNGYAMFNLGYYYKAGKGVDQDHQQAFSWFKKAADAGNAYAMVEVGRCYRYGHGVEQYYSQAAFLPKSC